MLPHFPNETTLRIEANPAFAFLMYVISSTVAKLARLERRSQRIQIGIRVLQRGVLNRICLLCSCFSCHWYPSSETLLLMPYRSREHREMDIECLIGHKAGPWVCTTLEICKQPSFGKLSSPTSCRHHVQSILSFSLRCKQRIQTVDIH